MNVDADVLGELVGMDSSLCCEVMNGWNVTPSVGSAGGVMLRYGGFELDGVQGGVVGMRH